MKPTFIALVILSLLKSNGAESSCLFPVVVDVPLLSCNDDLTCEVCGLGIGLPLLEANSLYGVGLSLGVSCYNDSIQGVDISVLRSYVENNCDGVLFSLFSTFCSGRMCGVQMCFLCNYAGRNSIGVQFAPFNSTDYGFSGARVGMVNFSFNSINALEFGIVNYVFGGETVGAQIGGFNHVADISGVQIGFVNSCFGISLTGELYKEGGGCHGGMIGVVNSSEYLCGFQVGILNYSRTVQGTQIGVVNVADNLNGVQIGILNYCKNTTLPYIPLINWSF